jgi:hypothetical protein
MEQAAAYLHLSAEAKVLPGMPLGSLAPLLRGEGWGEGQATGTNRHFLVLPASFTSGKVWNSTL